MQALPEQEVHETRKNFLIAAASFRKPVHIQQSCQTCFDKRENVNSTCTVCTWPSFLLYKVEFKTINGPQLMKEEDD